MLDAFWKLAALFSLREALREALSTFTEGGVAALSPSKIAAADFFGFTTRANPCAYVTQPCRSRNDVDNSRHLSSSKTQR
jgi:hypothetical protein